jgi:putative oxidoreductase
MKMPVIDASASLSVASLLGRIALAVLFLSSAVAHSVFWSASVQETIAGGIPAPVASLTLGLGLEYVGGVMVLLGLRTRIGATLLIVFMVFATAYFKDFWSSATPDPAQIQAFLVNVAVIGGLLILLASGPGPISLDKRA